MRLSTRTNATFAIAAAASLFGAAARAQSLDVKGNAWFGTGGNGRVGIGSDCRNACAYPGLPGTPLASFSPDVTCSDPYGSTWPATRTSVGRLVSP
jgi:hypothetical protein